MSWTDINNLNCAIACYRSQTASSWMSALGQTSRRAGPCQPPAKSTKFPRELNCLKAAGCTRPLRIQPRQSYQNASPETFLYDWQTRKERKFGGGNARPRVRLCTLAHGIDHLAHDAGKSLLVEAALRHETVARWRAPPACNFRHINGETQDPPSACYSTSMLRRQPQATRGTGLDLRNGDICLRSQSPRAWSRSETAIPSRSQVLFAYPAVERLPHTLLVSDWAFRSSPVVARV